MGQGVTFAYPPGATPLGPDELTGLKFGHITTRGELDELEQANIAQGLLWLERSRGGDILSEDFLRRLHKQLFGDVWKWAGTLRIHETNIGCAPFEIAPKLHILLGDARFWSEGGTFSPLEAAARFHHRMVQIHLFPNGNGRHARIAADIYLERYFECPAIDWAGGFDLQTDNVRRDSYIRALQSADAGQLEPLLEFVGLRR
ncbi:MAG: mobile mystery protein B [Gammaproteobacteria bacterium]|nr:mobile mystery protein B [Gammaproteobacteria bacterium]